MFANSVAVMETSDDPEMVAIIRAHAQELNAFVKRWNAGNDARHDAVGPIKALWQRCPRADTLGTQLR